jgi:hypothetical protein
MTAKPASRFSPHQAKYFAWWLTRKAPAEIAMSRTLATARVDMNPHQVEAALFALRSPLSQGVLLADEVGLGKTVEAGLVMAQLWVAGRRRILLVAPATLRKQWQQELVEKFGLPSRIVDARSYRLAHLERPTRSPFDVQDSIVICSYEFAAKKATELKALAFELVVLDEAHKLRSLHRGESAKRAWSLANAFEDRRKLLLTATPFQNSLLELYGLVCFIDPGFFGSKEAFQIQYAGARPSDEKLRELKHRLAGEDSSLELKAVYWNGSKMAGPTGASLAAEIASLANSRGGELLLGVDDKTREVSGIPLDKLDSVEQSLANWLETLIDPPPTAHIRRIEWQHGRACEPDFVVETPDRKWILEPKRRSELDSAEVQAKARAARRWCEQASGHAREHQGKAWRYLLLPHDAIRLGSTLAGLERAHGAQPS